MALASTSNVQIAYIKESTLGVTPVSGKPKELRVTGESLNFSVSKETSNELNAYRAPTSMVAVGAEAGGGLNYEFSYAEYDPLIEGVMFSTFNMFGVGGEGAATSMTLATGTITAGTATAGANAFTLLKKGQWFTLTGTGTANDGKLFRVSKTTAPTTTVITLDAGTPAIAGGPYANAKLRAARISNGTTQTSYSIERKVTDVGEYFVFRGMTPATMTLEMSSGSLTTGEFTFMGTDSERDTNTLLPTGGSNTTQSSKSYNVMSGVSGTSCALWVNGAPLTGTFISSINMSYDNTLRQQTALCKLGAVGVGSGTIAATFSMEVYFANGLLYEQMIANENIEMAFTAFDDSGNGYVFTLPKANIGDVTINAGSKDEDLMMSMEVTALLDLGNADPDLRRVIFIDRLGAAEAVSWT